MTMERFYVATTTGYLTPSADGAEDRRRQGVTAMVLDRGNLHRPAYLVRSEDLRPQAGSGTTALAIERAEQTCTSLNAGGAVPNFARAGSAHGTMGCYRYLRCRCARCRAANAQKQREYKARRKAR
jgi:hypothetical protein